MELPCAETASPHPLQQGKKGLGRRGRREGGSEKGERWRGKDSEEKEGDKKEGGGGGRVKQEGRTGKEGRKRG